MASLASMAPSNPSRNKKRNWSMKWSNDLIGNPTTEVLPPTHLDPGSVKVKDTLRIPQYRRQKSVVSQ
jgi:hypothetical protein